MLRRLPVAMLGLALMAPMAHAQSGPIPLLYACDLQSEPCRIWTSQWEPIFRASRPPRR